MLPSHLWMMQTAAGQTACAAELTTVSGGKQKKGSLRSLSILFSICPCPCRFGGIKRCCEWCFLCPCNFLSHCRFEAPDGRHSPIAAVVPPCHWGTSHLTVHPADASNTQAKGLCSKGSKSEQDTLVTPVMLWDVHAMWHPSHASVTLKPMSAMTSSTRTSQRSFWLKFVDASSESWEGTYTFFKVQYLSRSVLSCSYLCAGLISSTRIL